MTSTMPTRRHRAAGRRGYEKGKIPEYVRPDESVWMKPEPVARPISLPPVSMREISDSDIGLPEDPVAQLRAETYIKSVIAFRLREREKARDVARQRIAPGTVTIHTEVPNNSVVLVDPTDKLSSDDAVILAELRRLAGMPAPSWLNPEAVIPLAS